MAVKKKKLQSSTDYLAGLKEWSLPAKTPAKTPATPAISPTYNLKFDPMGWQSTDKSVLSEEAKSIRDLYYKKTGQRLEDALDAQEALKTSGVIGGARGGSQNVTSLRSGQNLFSSAVDALDAANRAADKKLGKGSVGKILGNLYSPMLPGKAFDALASKVDEKIPTRYKASNIIGEGFGKIDDAINVVDRAVTRPVTRRIAATPIIKTGEDEKPFTFGDAARTAGKGIVKGAGATAYGISQLPSPFPNPEGLVMRPNAPTKIRTLGDVSESSMELAANPNAIIDNTPDNKTPLLGSNEGWNSVTQQVLQGATFAETEVAVKAQVDAGNDPFGPNSGPMIEMRRRSIVNGFDDAQWNKLSFSEQLWRTFNKNDFTTVIMRSFFRVVGMTGAAPAGVKAIIEAVAAKMGGDPEEAQQVVESALAPYKSFRDQRNRLGFWEAAKNFIADNPQEALIVANAAARTASLAGGIAARSGIAGVGVAKFAERGAAVEARGAPITTLSAVETELPPAPRPGTSIPELSRASELLQAAKRENAERAALNEATTERFPLTIGHTGRGLFGTVALRGLKAPLATKYPWYRNRLLEAETRRAIRYAGNVRSGTGVRIFTELSKAIGFEPSLALRNRIGWNLSRPDQMLDGSPLTPAVEAAYFRAKIVQARLDLKKQYTEAEYGAPRSVNGKPTPEFLAFQRRNPISSLDIREDGSMTPEVKAQLELWEGSARALDAIEKVTVPKHVMVSVRVIAKKYGDDNTQLVADILGTTFKEAEKQNYIRLVAIDPGFEIAARALKAEKNAGRLELLVAQRKIAEIAARIDERLGVEGYAVRGKESGALDKYRSTSESRKAYNRDRADLIRLARVAEESARRYELDDIANQYAIMRRRFEKADSSESLAAAAALMEDVRNLRVADTDALPEAARPAYTAAQEASSVAARASRVVDERQAVLAAATAEAGVRVPANTRVIALAEKRINDAEENLASANRIGLKTSIAKAETKLSAAEDRLARLQTTVEAKTSLVGAQAVFGPLDKIARETNRTAQKVLKENTLVVDTDAVTAAVDAARGIAGVRMLDRADMPYFTIVQARGEVLEGFIARVKMTGVGGEAMLHLGSTPDLQRIAKVSRHTGSGVVDTRLSAGVRKGRLIESKGYLFTSGQEDLNSMWQNILIDTAELKSAAAWRMSVEKTVIGASRKLVFDEKVVVAAIASAKAKLKPGEVLEDIIQQELVAAMKDTGLAFEVNFNDWVLINPLDPRAKTPSSTLSFGSTRTEMGKIVEGDSVSSIIDRTINNRTIDPSSTGTYYLMPRASYDGFVRAVNDEAFKFTPGSMSRKLDEAARAWRNVQLNVLPRTAVNNFVGSTILAIEGGAGPRAFYYAARAVLGLKNKDGNLMPYPEVLRQFYYDQITARSGNPTSGYSFTGLANRVPDGFVGTAADYGAAGVAAWMNGMRRINGMSEDFGRLAVYYSQAYPVAMREAGARRFFLRGQALNDEAMGWLNKMADGDPLWEVQNAAWMRKSFDFLGDLHRGGKFASSMRIAFPFWQWYAHIVKLHLFTMPLKYPLRAEFLLMLSRVGDDYQREHGITTPYGASYIPFFEHNEMINEETQTVIDSINAQAWNPGATWGEFGSRDGKANIIGVVGQNTTPIFRNPILLLMSAAAIGGGGSALTIDKSRYIAAVRDEFGLEVTEINMQFVHYAIQLALTAMPLNSTLLNLGGLSQTSHPGNVKPRLSGPAKLGRTELDLMSRLDDPLANWPAFVLKLTTGVGAFSGGWTKTPGAGPLTDASRVKDLQYQINQERFEANTMRKALLRLALIEENPE